MNEFHQSSTFQTVPLPLQLWPALQLIPFAIVSVCGACLLALWTFVSFIRDDNEWTFRGVFSKHDFLNIPLHFSVLLSRLFFRAWKKWSWRVLFQSAYWRRQLLSWNQDHPRWTWRHWQVSSVIHSAPFMQSSDLFLILCSCCFPLFFVADPQFRLFLSVEDADLVIRVAVLTICQHQHRHMENFLAQCRPTTGGWVENTKTTRAAGESQAKDPVSPVVNLLRYWFSGF